ncbi:G patch domain and ankyrin repeat-containing protein 1 [Dorcoceras hygrometricum]|uniref:G patch domain and ankyrin repeat-containing protein 1 n=1 Tax=Dorcoceras hygrometricum TaxID=472368 RepID=A0A2Z7AYU8_9LAMI|nr:G patch domain and ankyrin repeat-containing protein 1 [Dorcoceras hygrometricum]
MELRAETADACSSASTPIDSSNIGFRLLKKHGWKEGTGLGIAEQGRLEPIQAYYKKNKRGLGADKPKKAAVESKFHDVEDPKVSQKKAKTMSKKMKKMHEFEKQLEEKEFERAFFREFWPDNV